MKVLFANNYLYLRGGSERVLFEEARLLKQHKHGVAYLTTDDGYRGDAEDPVYVVPKTTYSARNIPRFIYSRLARDATRALIAAETPDIAHLHNIYGGLTPSILTALKAHKIPAVLTLHDYKLVCPTYTLSRAGKTCDECRGQHFYRAAVNRCKQGSLMSSSVLALEAYIHKWLGLWRGNVRTLIAPSRFMRNKMVENGWDEKRIAVVPNFLPLDRYEPSYDAGKYLLFIGRLSGEKGVETLVNAARQLGGDAEVRIVGDGPLTEKLKAIAAGGARVKFTGYLSGDALASAIKMARAVVVPSEWYENAPMSVLEAMAYGKPVIGARIGGIPEMIEEGVTGFLFESGNVKELREKLDLVSRMANSEIEQMGRAARRHVEEYHSAERHYSRLMDVYSGVLGH